MDVWFHGYNCLLAPSNWSILPFACTNRLYVVLGGHACFLSEAGELPLRKEHLYLFPHRLPFRVRQDANDRINHLYFDFVLTPPLTGDQVIELPLERDSIIGHTVAAILLAVKPYAQRTSADETLVRRYFLNLLQLVLEQSGTRPLADERLTPVLRCMHERFAQPLSDADFCRMAHLEKNHFIRVFKRAMGMTPYQYLREYRLNRATVLIEQGTTVSEAAVLCGFESAASLSHAMRRSRGLSPTAAAGRMKKAQKE